jgi:hypothetical protein
MAHYFFRVSNKHTFKFFTDEAGGDSLIPKLPKLTRPSLPTNLLRTTTGDWKGIRWL